MPWRNEIDRMVSHCVVDAAKEGGDKQRALTAVTDLLALAPGRAESWFHVGTARELYGEGAAALPTPTGPAQEQWSMLGALDSAGRRGVRERVVELMAAPAFAAIVPTPAGRVALRAVGRMLLRDGEEERAFELYQRHLAVVKEEGSLRDAEFLLEEALRRADRGDEEGDADAHALANLDRAARFVREAGLDARAGAKVDRKLGRLHQLGQRWPDAVSCYRRALEHLPKDDPYRSVLVGDLALATLGVRGTLDLLPVKDRPNAAEAEALLKAEEGQGDGRSYNALYTLGMLAYERGEHGPAAAAFREADVLMRENRAKARIVHARARFFYAHCMLALGAQGADLEDAARILTKESQGVSLDPALKDAVYDALLAVVPDARIPGRGGRDRDRERGPRREREPRGDRDPRAEREPRADRPPREFRGEGDGRGPRAPREGGREAPAAMPQDATGCLIEARRWATKDPHKALELVDRTFKSRPDFETWFGAYRVRLDALLALGEREEALSTYERFRSKLYQRSAFDRIEGLLLDPQGPMRSVLGEAGFHEELVELYEVMPGRRAQLVAAAQAAARAHLEANEPARVARAVGLLRDAASHDDAAVAPLLAAAREAAARVGAVLPHADAQAARAKLAGRPAPLRLLVIGGDEGRRPHADRLREISEQLGFHGGWLFTGARPPQKVLSEIEGSARGADVLLLHHGAGRELRDEVRRIGSAHAIPVREATWLGTATVQDEVLEALSAAR